MSDQQPPAPAEDLTGYYAPHPPIRCAALVDAGPQDGPGGGQGGLGGGEADSEPSGGVSGSQTGAQGLARFHRLRDQLAALKAKLDAAHDAWPAHLDDLRVTPMNGMSAGISNALFLLDHHLRAAEAGRTTPDNPTSSDTADNLHARLTAAIRDCPARYPDDVAAALLPVVQRETAQLRRERDMALNAAREARATLERGKP